MFRWLWSSSSSSSSSTMPHQQQEEQQEELQSVALQHQEDVHRQLASTTNKNTIDLIDLTDFDVQMALTDNLGVQIFEVTDIVTRWMNDAFRICLQAEGFGDNDNGSGSDGTGAADGDTADVDSYADFDTIILLERNYNNRLLQQEDGDGEETAAEDGDGEALEDGGEVSAPQAPPSATESDTEADTPKVPTTADTRIGELYTAAFKGAALFVREDDDLRVPDSTVLSCQRQALREDAVLLSRLQQSSALGLGLSVIDVRAFVNPLSNNNNGNSNAMHSGSATDDSLEVVIIVAIVIACVAFLFLIFAIFWAWRYDKRNRQAYLAHHSGSQGGGGGGSRSSKQQQGRKSHRGSSRDGDTYDAQDSPESKNEAHARAAPPHSSYPSVIGGDSVFEGGVYPESVISEDIESSLSQYYTSSAAYHTGTARIHGQSHMVGTGRFQAGDAASVSSMESYGYSLDGYAPSLATPMPSDSHVVTAHVISSSSQNQPYSMAAAANAPLPTEPAPSSSSPVNVSDFTDVMDNTLADAPDDEENDDVDDSSVDDDTTNYDVSLSTDISAVNTTMNSHDHDDKDEDDADVTSKNDEDAPMDESSSTGKQ